MIELPEASTTARQLNEAIIGKRMDANGGRDTERDLILSKNTSGKPCSTCGDIIKKEAYLGGSIYYCPTCQRG